MDCAHAQVGLCTCSTGSMCIHNWKCAHAFLERVHAEVKCAYAQLACTCSPESVHMLNLKRAHAKLESCTCSIGSVHMRI